MCGERLGRTKYDDKNVKNHNERGDALTCKECKAKLKHCSFFVKFKRCKMVWPGVKFQVRD